MSKTKNRLLMILGAAAVVAVGLWVLLSGPEHVEDTNGPENTALQTITDQQIVEMSVGAVGGPTISKSALTGDTVEFSSDRFTGVSEILYDSFLLPSDFVLNLTGYEILGGNVRLVVVHDDAIVATIEPGLFPEYRLEDVTGTVSLRIAGESAAFRFSMSQWDYDQHSHAE